MEVPPDSIGDVVAALLAEQFVLARVHTHPGRAYHSSTDDRNLLLAHPGAVSVVVPAFAEKPGTARPLPCSRARASAHRARVR